MITENNALPALMAGIVTYQSALDDWVKADSLIAKLVLLEAEEPT